ncbi:MAG: hypothetical protein WDZ45_02460 [Flavobacteriaceae bacterium]
MKVKVVLLLLLGCTVFGVGVVAVLFLLSEDKMQRNNAFQRRYMPEAVEEMGHLTLDYNAYYIAGMEGDTIYLGNVSAPLYLTKVDTELTGTEEIQIEISDLDLPYQRVKTSVVPPYFYLGDGTVPVLFKGSIDNFKADYFSFEDAYFTEYVVADSNVVGIATISGSTGSKALGMLIKTETGAEFEMNTSLLKKQQDGVFDTDGILLWNEKHQVFIYTYYYRNQFVIADSSLKLKTAGTTIDTIRRAILDVAHYSSKDQFKLGGRSVYVNRQSATSGDYLYIHSDRLGKYEKAAVLEQASIIDVYNITTTTYAFSFYVFHQKGKRLNDFKVYGNLLVVLVEDVLWIYRLNPNNFDLALNSTYTARYQEND